MSASHDTSPGRDVEPTQAIIQAVADHEGIDVTDVEPPAYDPLYTVVNPEALDSLFQGPTAAANDGHVVLEYEGYEIVVHSDGRVVVTDPSVDADSGGRVVRD